MTGGTGPDDLARTAELLHREFAAPKFADPAYLRWYYEESPEGPAIHRVRDDEHGRLATYALVPQRWRNGSEVATLGITVDACVRTGAQRAGVFRGLATEVFDAAADRGVEGTLTIANANSTPAFVDKLGLEPLGGLPVRVVPTRPGGARASALPCDDATIAALAADAAARTTPGWVHDWDAASLRWRLTSPVREYALHRSDDLWCVSARDALGPLPAAVVLALVPRDGRRGLNAGPLIAAVTRHHRAAFAVHAGRNADVRVPGLPVPRRLLPSPLNLLVRGFGGRPTGSLRNVGTYEFLDTDHY